VKLYSASPRTLLRYLSAYEQHGVAGLLDSYHRSGRRTPRFDGEVMHFLAVAARAALREEGPTIQIVIERVRDAFVHENERRKRTEPPIPPLEIPGREAVRSELVRISPLEYALRTRSRVTAERSMRPVGQGPVANRAL